MSRIAMAPMLGAIIASGFGLEPVAEPEPSKPPELPPQPCDGCTACCKLLGVQELEKPPNVKCGHCKPGVGCGIYESRPPSCVVFECAYRQGYMGEGVAKRPDNTHVVFTFTVKEPSIPVAWVDPHYANAWREGEAGEWFGFMVERLGRGIVVVGPRRSAVGKGWKAGEIEQRLTEDPHAAP